MAAGVAGSTLVITSLEGALFVQTPPTTFIVSTVLKLMLKLTFIDVVPCPEIIVAPTGTVQV